MALGIISMISLFNTSITFSSSSWEEALFTVATKLRQVSPSSAIAAVAGSMNDAESLVALKDLLNRFNSEHVYSDGEFPSSISGGIDLRSNYLLNDKLNSVDNCDVLLLIGALSLLIQAY